MTNSKMPIIRFKKASPFLKWAGGKRWLATTLARFLRDPQGSYFEPFLGAGSVFFQVECKSAFLSDINEELVNAYRIVRNQPDELMRLLDCLAIRKSLFQTIRKENCKGSVARAARMLYLNKTAFNGLYRVNKRGEFNVPFGCKAGTKLLEKDNLQACSVTLQKAVVTVADFRAMLELVQPNDSVFLDPPYTVKHDNNGFRQYNEQIFSWNDQVLLASMANRLARAGVRIAVTNAFHSEIVSLYSKKHFRRYVASRPTTMAARATARGVCKELVLISDAADQMAIQSDHLLRPLR